MGKRSRYATQVNSAWPSLVVGTRESCEVNRLGLALYQRVLKPKREISAAHCMAREEHTLDTYANEGRTTATSCEKRRQSQWIIRLSVSGVILVGRRRVGPQFSTGWGPV